MNREREESEKGGWWERETRQAGQRCSYPDECWIQSTLVGPVLQIMYLVTQKPEPSSTAMMESIPASGRNGRLVDKWDLMGLERFAR